MGLSEQSIRNAELLSDYRANPSTANRNRIVEYNLPLIRRIVGRLNYPSGVTPDELVQVGVLGLITIIPRFDPSKGCTFATYAVPSVRGYLSQYLRDRVRSIRVSRTDQEIWHAGGKLYNAAAGRITSQEIADQLGISLETWRRARSNNRSVASLNTPLPPFLGNDAGTRELIDLIQDESDYNPEAVVQSVEAREILDQALDSLPKVERDALLACLVRGETRKGYAACIQVSSMTVTRRIQRGVLGMQKYFKDRGISEEHLRNLGMSSGLRAV